jgi:hypothetical protein
MCLSSHNVKAGSQRRPQREANRSTAPIAVMPGCRQRCRRCTRTWAAGIGGGRLPCPATMSRKAAWSRSPMAGARRQCDASAAVTTAVCRQASMHSLADRAHAVMVAAHCTDYGRMPEGTVGSTTCCRLAPDAGCPSANKERSHHRASLEGQWNAPGTRWCTCPGHRGTSRGGGPTLCPAAPPHTCDRTAPLATSAHDLLLAGQLCGIIAATTR